MNRTYSQNPSSQNPSNQESSSQEPSIQHSNTRHSINSQSCHLLVIAAVVYGCFGSSFVNAEEQVAKNINSKQDVNVIKKKVKEFLQIQATGLPGKVDVNVMPIDARLKLNSCPSLVLFLPNGSRAWGKTSVGVRCAMQDADQNDSLEKAQMPWTIYVQANVAVITDYLIAAAPLSQGQVISNSDVLFQQGDLTKLPPGIYTNVAQVIGSTVKVSLMAGSVLRQEMLKLPLAVQQGQTVTLSSSGNGYRVTAEGKALASVSEGQIVQVKIASGQVVSGVAKSGGLIEVGF